MKKILFVCTGNICRSPTADAVLRHAIKTKNLMNLSCDSAGMQAYHIGEAPDRRTIATARTRGIMMDDLRARQIEQADFEAFDIILGMDSGHVRQLQHIAPKKHHAHIGLFLEYAGHQNASEVPDPYYGQQKDFEHVLNLIEEGIAAMLNKIHS